VNIVRFFWSRLLPAGLSGCALAAAFPPFYAGWIVFPALVPLLFVIDRSSGDGAGGGALSCRRLFGAGWFFGFVFFFVLLRWIGHLTTERMVYPWLRWPALVAAASYLACYPGLFALAQGFLRRRLGRRAMALAPVTWMLVEVARASGALGFPWGAPGYGLLLYPSLIQGASVGGVDILSFWVVAVGVSLWWFLVTVRSRPRSALVAGMIPVVLLAGPWAWGRARIPEGEWPRLGSVGIVQPSIRGDEKWDAANKESTFSVLERSTRLLGKRSVDLIIWPETAVPVYVRYDAEYFGRTRTLAREVSCPILAGFPDAEFDADERLSKYNAAGLFARNGNLVETYWKIHLVPFGEALPWQDRFPVLEKIDLGEGDYSPGRERTVFNSGLGRFSVLICFEAIFPRLAREFADQGIDFLVNITNDDWFGDTPAAPQHAAMAVMRAVENGMSLVRCANSGISGVVDPFGRIEVSTPLFKRLELTASVGAPLPGGTLYRRIGDGFVWLCGILMAASLVAAVMRRPGPR